jgi:PKD repeat protein
MFPVDLECSFTWDFGGSGNVVGGNGNGLIVYQYDAPGTYTATLTTTVETSGLSLSDTVTAYAIEIQPPPPTGDFVTSINGNTVTLTAIGLDASIMRAYIYWGDRKRTVAYAPQTDFAAGLEYTYNRGGTSYNIRIMTLDSDHNEFNYTFNVDGDLTVNVP